MAYVFADLFCGCGGLSIGFINAGFVDAIAADFWDVAKDNYLSYKPLAKTTFFQTNMLIEEERKSLSDIISSSGIDILAGGPPCQGFSTLGKREEDDTRNTLVDAFLNCNCHHLVSAIDDNILPNIEEYCSDDVIARKLLGDTTPLLKQHHYGLELIKLGTFTNTIWITFLTSSRKSF